MPTTIDRALVRITVLVAISLSMATQAHAAETHACAGIAQPAKRLACYDQAFPPAVTATTLEQQGRSDFGLTQTEIRERDPALARAAPPDRIEAGVVAVGGRSGEGRIFTLDNGQIWRQVESTTRGNVAVGDRVSIKRSAVSSGYLLITSARIPLRVRRTK